MNKGQLHFPKLSLTINATLPHSIIQQHVPGSVVDLGKIIAKNIDAYVGKNKLGYYPALSYFSDTDAVEDFLLDAIDQVAEVVQRLSEQGILDTLTPIFSTVHVDSLRNRVYTLPSIRLKDRNVIQKLNQHYCADSISFELQVSLIQRDGNTDSLDGKIKKMVMRWLTDVFEQVEITSVHMLSTPK